MKLYLSIHYIPNNGQTISLRFNSVRNGSVEDYIIEHSDLVNNFWHFNLEVEECTYLNYIYFFKDENGVIHYEAGGPRELSFDSGLNMRICDEWRGMDENAPFLTDAFKNILFNSEERQILSLDEFNISVPPLFIQGGYRLFICGNSKILGNWNLEHSVQMRAHKNGNLYFRCKYDVVSDLSEYKFLLWDGNQYIWENGNNRRLLTSAFDGYNSVIINHSIAYFNIEKPKFCGTSVPVFSLRSRNSAGIGDFGDMIDFIDLLHITNQSIFQILPVNDTTRFHDNRDSYPYGSISVFALNPVYLNLQMAGSIKDKEYQEFYLKEIQKLNKCKALDYKGVSRLKLEYIKIIFKQDKDSLFKSKDYKQFFENNCDWLIPYAAFCYLRDKYGNADFRKWGDYATYNEDEIKNLVSPNGDKFEDIAIHYFIQYHLDKQLRAAHEYASRKRIILKGDIPIGINRDSADAWINPHLFDFESQAGAPPDYFSDEGQVWGFPTYRWDIMISDGLSWWRRRLAKMSEYFDAYRIDHILGFFRIWEIPINTEKSIYGVFNPSLPYSYKEITESGFNFDKDMISHLFIEDRSDANYYHPRINGFKTNVFHNLSESQKVIYQKLYNGYFYHRNEHIWYENAMKKLPPLIATTGMLACAEDLGMVPSCVKDVLEKLKILSLQIERMPKKSGVLFDRSEENPYLSVCTTSTHDTSTLRGSWREEASNNNVYFREVLNNSGIAPADCETWLCKSIIERHLLSPSIFTIIPLQDWFSLLEELRRDDFENERINNPSNPLNYWGYRMHIEIKELITNIKFVSIVKTLIQSSGRGAYSIND